MMDAKGTVVVTGANGGLGSAIVSKIVSTPELSRFHGLYTARDSSTASTLKSALRTPNGTHPHAHTIISLDLSRMESVRAAARDINSRIDAGEIPPIRALILNAGWNEFQSQTWTEDGFDMAFAVNYLGHWLLTLLLLKSMDREVGRVVVLGSLAHDPDAAQNNAGRQFTDKKWKVILRDGTESVAKGTWSTTKEDSSWRAGFRRYGASKLCELLMIGELQRRLDGDPILNKVSVVGIDPGTMPTDLSRRGPWIMRVVLFQLILPLVARIMTLISPNGSIRTATKSSADVIAAAFTVEHAKGLYLDGQKQAQMSAEARDPEKQRLLWQDTVAYTQLKEGETMLAHWT
ncbi:hypothetical protein GGR51DRAFT_531244 [Nemania sp. FL0031]|nr:hypothetical protein GGR51DRAFT_531244 [Nemania sp. FL0031]